jgi:putative acetyltransferase
MNLNIRIETTGDYPAVYEVNRLAFGRVEEAELVERIRPLTIEITSMVAVLGDMIVGHVLFSPVTVQKNPGAIVALGLGPVAILPDYQRQGFGTRLTEAGLRQCKLSGCKIVFVLGHPEYYPRFGFKPAVDGGFYYKNHEFDPYFFFLELEPGAAFELSGEVHYLPPFDEA